MNLLAYIIASSTGGFTCSVGSLSFLFYISSSYIETGSSFTSYGIG